MKNRLKYVFTILLLAFVGAVSESAAQSDDLRRAATYVEQGEYTQAIPILRSEVRRDLTLPDAWTLLAISYVETGLPESAEMTAEEGLENYPQNGDLYWIYAESVLMQQRPEEALALFEELYREYARLNFGGVLDVSENAVRNRVADSRLMVSSVAYQNGDLTGALELIDQALSARPDDAEALRNRVYLLMEMERWDEALSRLEGAKEAFEDELLLNRIRASIYYNLEDAEGLLEEFEQLYRSDPGDIETAITYAEILFMNKQGGEASQVFRDLLDRYPDERDIYLELARLHEQRLYLNEKAAVLEQMLERFPGDQEALKELGNTYSMNRNWPEAREIWVELKELSGEAEAYTHRIADTWLEEEKPEMAIGVLLDLLHEKPEKAGIRVRAGQLLMDLENWEESIEVFNGFEDEEKRMLLGGPELAFANLKSGNREAAAVLSEQVTEREMEHPLLWLTRADLAISEGDTDTALAYTTISVEYSFMRLRQMREVASEQVSGGERPVQTTDTMEEIDRIEKMSDMSFNMLTSRFSGDQIEDQLHSLREDFNRSPSLLLQIAEFRKKQGADEQAMKELEHLLRVNPRVAEAHKMIARLHLEKGEVQQAILSAERAIGLESTSEEGYRILVQIHEQEGDLDQLASRLKQRLKGDRNNEVLREFVIELLHRTDRFEEAAQILNR